MPSEDPIDAYGKIERSGCPCRATRAIREGDYSEPVFGRFDGGTPCLRSPKDSTRFGQRKTYAPD
jgi:hypothetical protein